MSHPLPQSVISLVKALIMTNFLGFVTINVVVAFYMIITLIKKKNMQIFAFFLLAAFMIKSLSFILLSVLG